jgi:hypothetical protein
MKVVGIKLPLNSMQRSAMAISKLNLFKKNVIKLVSRLAMLTGTKHVI